MTSEGIKLTRRKFIAAGSAAIAAPLIMDMIGPVPVTAGTVSGKTYYIGHRCIGCQVCRLKCPSSAINFGDDRNEIDQDKCRHCGTCYRNCPISVITES